jgi:hypothetical protein
MNYGYFRAFNTLLDDKDMKGNCKDAGDHYGTNEMYPCIYDQLTYGKTYDIGQEILELYLYTT